MSVDFGRSIRLLALGIAGSLVCAAADAREPGEPAPRPARPAATARTPAAAKPDAAKPAKPDDLPMQVQIVRSSSPGCEPNCLEWVSAQGKIMPETRARFISVLGKLGTRRLPIFIDSGGGHVDAALAIARLIRSKGFDVVVTRTALTPCAESDTACRKRKASGTAQGQPQARLAKCLSSCAFILAGGVNRLVGATSFVGVHQVATFNTMAQVRRTYRITRSLFAPPEKKLVSEEVLSRKVVRGETPDSTYVKIDKFFAELGIDRSIGKMITETPHEKLHVLTPAELTSTKMMTARLNGEDLDATFARTGAYQTSNQMTFPQAKPPTVFVPRGVQPSPPVTATTPPAAR